MLGLGTGKGIWAIDTADAYDTVTVIGCDIDALQPPWMPPNSFFGMQDVENDCFWKRTNLTSFTAASKNSRSETGPHSSSSPEPGAGYLVNSDEGFLPENLAYAEISELFFEIGEENGASGAGSAFYK